MHCCWDLFWPASPLSGTSSPADTGPCSGTTNWAAWWLYNEDAASRTLDSPQTITMASTDGRSWPFLVPAVSSEFIPAAKLGLQSACDWIIHSTNVHCDVYSMTSTAPGKRDIRMEPKCFSYQYIPLSKLPYSMRTSSKANSFSQQAFIKHFLCARHHSRHSNTTSILGSVTFCAGHGHRACAPQPESVMWPSVITKPLWSAVSLLENGGNNSN